MPQSLDLVNFASLTPQELADACQRAMDGCDAFLADVVAIAPGTRTFANTLLPLEEATDLVSEVSGQYAFMAYVTADDELRKVARAWDETLDKYMVGLSFREDIYQAIKEYSETADAKNLVGEEARWLEFELRDYRRNGFDLPLAERQKIRGLFDSLVELDVKFRKNIDDYEDGLTLNREQLASMPESWVESLKTVEERGVTKYKVSLDYPEIQPFMANCPDGTLRRELFEKDQRKGGGGQRPSPRRCDSRPKRNRDAARLRLVGCVPHRNADGEDAGDSHELPSRPAREGDAEGGGGPSADALTGEGTRWPRRHQHLGLAVLSQRTSEDEIRGR